MGIIGGILRFFVKRLIFAAIVVTALVLIPGIPPHCSFTEITLPPALPRNGVLAPNNALDNAKRLLENKIHGPECFQVHNGELYTSIGTGEIVKLSPNGHMTFITKIGLPCEGVWQEHKCGRPLGFRIDDAGKYLYVVDAYYGIWKVDLKTDKKELLVSPRVEIERRAPKLFNSIALAKNGDFYWTDSSSDFELRDGAFSTLTDPTGRLFHYNAVKNQSRVLLDGLWFSNGVALSPNEEFVLAVECLASRIHRIYVDGPKKGQKDVFIEGLPGILDNLQPLPDGSGVLVGVYVTYDDSNPLISRVIAPFPLLRKFLARLQRVIEIPFHFLNQHIPHYVFEKVAHSLGHFSSMNGFLPQGAGLVQLDWSGKVVGAWFNQDGSTAKISDAIVYQDTLYMGGPNSRFLATLPAPEQLKKAFSKQNSLPETKKQEQIPKKVEQSKAKPTEPPAVKKTSEPVKPAPKQEKPKEQPKVENPKEAPKATTSKPREKKVEQPKPAIQLPKPVVQQPTPTTEPPKAQKPVEPKKTERKPKPVKKDPKKPDQIPIVESIPVDTAKPTKEPLKVIKKEGPAEIPHPEL